MEKSTEFTVIKKRYEKAYNEAYGIKPHSITHNKGNVKINLFKEGMALEFTLSGLLESVKKLEKRIKDDPSSKKVMIDVSHRY